MNNRFDVVIVGGGVIGCSVAYHLARKRVRVAVLERSAVGGQASAVAAGMLAAQEEASAPDDFFDAGIASRAMFKELVPAVREDSGVDPEWETCGIWRVAETEEDAGTLREKVRWQTERGMKAEFWSPEDVLKRLPSLRGATRGALYCPEDGQLDSAKWVRALAEAARYRGVRIDEPVPHLEFVRDGAKVTAVRTPTEMYEADRFVIAAGAWTPFLLESFGVTLPLEPVKGQVLVLEMFPRLLPGPVFVGKGYFAPKAAGRLIVGGTMEKVGFDQRPTLSAQRMLADFAMKWCPDLESRQVFGLWSGLRPGTADERPVMGLLPGWENVHVCAGHFRNGVLMSPFSGQFMADGLADNVWDPRGLPFTPGRFPAASAPSESAAGPRSSVERAP